MGIGKLIYNFTSWSFRAVGEEVFEIAVTDAREYPEPARYTAQGFLRRFAEFAAIAP